jgi:hypothetical protein
MPRTSTFTAGSLLLLALLAGCGERMISPTATQLEAPSAAPAPASLAPQGRPSVDLSGGLPDSTAVDFVVGPSGGVFRTGNHAVVFPAESVCDPGSSSYGPGTWDDPCTPLQSTIKVHAEVRRTNAGTLVDFTPSLRFVPSSNSGKWVWLIMYTPRALDATGDLSKFNILWENTIGGTLVDETPTDATLRTYVDTWQGLSFRRIKHFSGYLTESGRSCTSPTEGC